MKLRIKGNSIRLRLTQSEISQIGQGQVVREKVYFGSSLFSYALSADSSIFALDAQFQDQEIRVRIPASQAAEWARSEQVGIEEKVAGREGHQLHVLIEKDFQCLHKRPDEDESDHFPNPATVRL